MFLLGIVFGKDKPEEMPLIYGRVTNEARQSHEENIG
jgi:hypothetical protein